MPFEHISLETKANDKSMRSELTHIVCSCLFSFFQTNNFLVIIAENCWMTGADAKSPSINVTIESFVNSKFLIIPVQKIQLLYSVRGCWWLRGHCWQEGLIELYYYYWVSLRCDFPLTLFLILQPFLSLSTFLYYILLMHLKKVFLHLYQRQIEAIQGYCIDLLLKWFIISINHLSQD